MDFYDTSSSSSNFRQPHNIALYNPFFFFLFCFTNFKSNLWWFLGILIWSFCEISVILGKYRLDHCWRRGIWRSWWIHGCKCACDMIWMKWRTWYWQLHYVFNHLLLADQAWDKYVNPIPPSLLFLTPQVIKNNLCDSYAQCSSLNFECFVYYHYMELMFLSEFGNNSGIENTSWWSEWGSFNSSKASWGKSILRSWWSGMHIEQQGWWCGRHANIHGIGYAWSRWRCYIITRQHRSNSF